jgi:hypothetical protein
MKYLKTFNESREDYKDLLASFKKSEEREERKEKEGTFDYFMTKSREELLDYQKNFQHSFENPAEHDPKYVAWKKACAFKGCFKVPSIKTLRKRRELEGMADDDWIYTEENKK